jgi:hypothetical protein
MPGVVLLTLGEQIGIHMERRYGIDGWLNRVLTGVEQLPKIAATFRAPLWVQALPSTTVHTMRPYVIEESEDHAYFIAEGDTRVWRYRWLTQCGSLVLRVEAEPTRLITERSRLEVYREMPPWCRLCTSCARMMKQETEVRELRAERQKQGKEARNA